MLNLPSTLQAQFVVFLRNEAVRNDAHASHLKWLRYYLDFCEKYHFLESKSQSLTHFLHKLEEKRQTKSQQQEASRAVSLYYELIHSVGSHHQLASPQKVLSPGKLPDESPRPSDSSLNQAANPEVTAPQGQVPKEPHLPLLPPTQTRKVTTGVSWKAEYAKLAQAIQVRHYSPKALKTYTQWVRDYQTFTRSNRNSCVG